MNAADEKAIEALDAAIRDLDCVRRLLNEELNCTTGNGELAARRRRSLDEIRKRAEKGTGPLLRLLCELRKLKAQEDKC